MTSTSFLLESISITSAPESAYDHVGSTAVEGLAAKPIIDIDLIVENPEDEASYLLALEALGYELTIREPSWYQHRMLKLHHPMVNLHVFGKDCPEYYRHLHTP
ncbi:MULTISPECIES: GrpB family protein [Gammaproteobacteria]|uniref:GrpB family protein n=1 Tax=Gammaproteobacteria TaxID=1236 RepID=UPI001C8F5028|nr:MULTISPECIES: GrpB family protein [Enterobacterales]MCF1201279.1 GrpB family protein [Escherichia coli]MCF1239123.1 GrpB family protein [Escherichia coli]MCH6333462.1 GrpB family protein [Escherichia coli]MCH6338063.1 GrpB family protein [Escherichia coli]MCL7078795.1 GrpB family protein [Escherichia coli]